MPRESGEKLEQVCTLLRQLEQRLQFDDLSRKYTLSKKGMD
jgi:hypothetical protein